MERIYEKRSSKTSIKKLCTVCDLVKDHIQYNFVELALKGLNIKSRTATHCCSAK